MTRDISKQFFVMRERVRFKLLPGGRGSGDRALVTGCGLVTKINSHHVCFRSFTEFECGAAIELTIEWPVRLDGLVPLKLVIWGNVTRSHDHKTEVVYTRYEFRIRKRGGSSVSSETKSAAMPTM